MTQYADEQTGTRQSHDGVLTGNLGAGRVWGAGGKGYDRISAQIADALEHCVDRLDPRPGERILDVATGTGWTARRIAVRGARVTGVDIGEGVIEAARDLSEGYDIDFRVGDAEALPFPDGHFDAVVSTFGVMFCADPEQAASELARVVKPGGRLALANWAPDSGVFGMFKLIKSHTPPAPRPAPSPFEWGHTSRQVELLEDDFDLGFETATTYYREPSGAAAWNNFSAGFGPVVALLETLADDAIERLRTDFEAFHESHRTGAGILVPREYVITVGNRRG
jgi:SAM-dependent methyltransferase